MAALEAVQRTQYPAGATVSELIDDPRAICAAGSSCAIKIARRIHGDAGDKLTSVLPAGEIVQNGQSLRSCWEHGENYHENGQSNERCFSCS